MPAAAAASPASSAAAPSPSDLLTDQLAGTLGHIVGQLDVLTRTMSLLEERLAMNEEKTNRVVSVIGAAAAVRERREEGGAAEA